MRSKKVEFRMRWDLYEALETESKKRGYKNMARYFFAIGAMDLFQERRISILKEVANCSPVMQDLILTEMIHFSGKIEDVAKLSLFWKHNGSTAHKKKKII